MQFSKNDHVRVKDIPGPAQWYGWVVEELDDSYRIRVGGTDHVVEVKSERVFPPYPLIDEAIEEDFKSHRLVILGDPHHGAYSARALVRALSSTGKHANVIFMEGAFYDELKGVAEGKKVFFDMDLLKELRCCSDLVVGLETDDTSPNLETHELEAFSNKRRCLVANRAWAAIVAKKMAGAINVVCCGTAHLATFHELDGIAKPLQQELHGLGLRIPNYAVADKPHGAYKLDTGKGTSAYLRAVHPGEAD
ncbi:hypothetical protein ABQJ54_14690 [Rhodanobacter sp. Si-c]|uniref:Uncharacterized protein n=1 Tax=Rhodanobacter lycopersici TaxID=3162487 RepID=A0ABV3QI94_9GAMM